VRVVNIVPSISSAGGGVCIAARRHDECLSQVGIDSCLFTKYHKTRKKCSYVYEGEKRYPRKVANRIRYELLKISRIALYKKSSGKSLVEGFSDGRVHDGQSIAEQIPKGDVFHVHLVDNFIGYKWFVRAIGEYIPVVWTLHDNMPLAGGCQSNFGCERYLTGCGMCPQLEHRGSRDASYQTYKRKKALFDSIDSRQITFVSASKEQCDMARRAPMTNRFEVLHVPLSINTEQYRVIVKEEVREGLGIDGNKLVVGFVSSGLGRYNKGFSVLVEAVNSSEILRNGVLLLLVGVFQRNGIVNKTYRDLRCESMALGRISTDEEMVKAYNAMDVLVAPSYQESYGQTVMEAMACGVPVLGSDIGGIRDQIKPGITGYLFEAGNSGDLRGLLLEIHENRGRLGQMAVSSRKAVEVRNSYSVVGSRFKGIYEAAVSKLRKIDR
jgi:glycosyltransferase involved in cell wall biosynthesis